jgi:hypothetical protein
VENQLEALNVEDKDSIIGMIPISKFNKNQIKMMEGKLSKAAQGEEN